MTARNDPVAELADALDLKSNVDVASGFEPRQDYQTEQFLLAYATVKRLNQPLQGLGRRRSYFSKKQRRRAGVPLGERPKQPDRRPAPMIRGLRPGAQSPLILPCIHRRHEIYSKTAGKDRQKSHRSGVGTKYSDGPERRAAPSGRDGSGAAIKAALASGPGRGRR